MKRLIPLSSIRHTQPDSVKERVKANNAKGKRDTILLNRAKECYNSAMAIDMRGTRRRNMRYVFGDQWGDYVYDKDGNLVKERDRIAKRTGGVVLQNNHLIKIVNTLNGVYSKSASMPTVFARVPEADEKSEMMTNALQANWEVNEMFELLSSGNTELICGGLEMIREDYGLPEGGDNGDDEDAYSYLVNPDYAIFDFKGLDPRGWDVDLIGEIKDYTIGELSTLLAESGTDYDQLAAIYRPWINSTYDSRGINDVYNGVTWDAPYSSRLCRTYHVWTHEHRLRYRCIDRLDFNNPIYWIELSDLPRIEAENAARVAMAAEQGMPLEEVPLIEYEKRMKQFWHFTMLSPNGDVLQEYDSPFEHGGHPYSFRAHQLVNGRVVPFISCIIDQQRYINRLITLQDLIIMASAKGVWKVPKDCLGDISEEEFAERAVEIGGIIFYEPSRTGKEPEQVTSNASLAGLSELMALQLSSINDITTVSESLQGKAPKANTAASRYAMEVQNSTTSIATLLAKQTALERSVARKKMETIHQYYNEPRPIGVQHPNGYYEYSEYQPAAVRDIKYRVAVRETEDAAVARLLVNDVIAEMWAAGQLTAQQRLKLSYIPGTQPIQKALQENGTADQFLQQGQLARGQQQAGNNSMQAQDENQLVEQYANRKLPITE